MASSLTAANSPPVVTVPAALSPAQLFEVARAREAALSRLLMAFVTT